jgi:hypothetical protein
VRQPFEVIKEVERIVEKPIVETKIEIVERIVEKPVYIDKTTI